MSTPTVTTTPVVRPAPVIPATAAETRRVRISATPIDELERARNFRPQTEPIYDRVAGDDYDDGDDGDGGENGTETITITRRRRSNSTGGGGGGGSGESEGATTTSTVRLGPNGLPYCEEKSGGMGARLRSAWARVRASDDGSRFVFPAIAALVSIVLFVIIVFMTGPWLIKIGALALVVAFVVYTYKQCRAVMATLF